jgi:hypothetical protein
MSELTTQNLEYFCHAVEVLMSVQGAPFEESNWLAIMRIGGGNNVHIVFSLSAIHLRPYVRRVSQRPPGIRNI